MPYATSGQIPRKPPRPPRPPYLPMRYVKWEQYYDIWPNKSGTPFPYDNSEYPQPSLGWCSLRDEQFFHWLLEKNVEPKWFHQRSNRKAKQELLDEFSMQWLEEGDCPIPKNILWIKNYGGHRDMFYNYEAVNRPVAYIKFVIQWLFYRQWLPVRTIKLTPLSSNGLLNKPKTKHATEQMATLAELFEGYEEEPKRQKERQQQRADIITDYNKTERMKRQ